MIMMDPLKTTCRQSTFRPSSISLQQLQLHPSAQYNRPQNRPFSLRTVQPTPIPHFAILKKPNRSFVSPFHFRLLLFPAPMAMANPESAPIEPSEGEKNVYSVWALPPEDVTVRIKTLMNSLRSEFGGPQFEPHITVVGAIRLTPDDALNKFRSACQGLKAYQANVDHVSTGSFFYQCVFLLLHPTTEVVETSSHCCRYFGYKNSTPYMPHLSLLYANISDEKKKQAKEIADKLDEAINGLSFPVTRLALYKTDTGDETLKSWEKIAEYDLPSS